MKHYFISANDNNIYVTAFETREAARDAMYAEVIERFCSDNDGDGDDYSLAKSALYDGCDDYYIEEDFVRWYDEGEYCWVVHKVVAENEIHVA